MPTYSPEDNLNLLIACFLETELKPDYAGVARRLGLPSARAAGDRVKKLVKDAESTLGVATTSPKKTPASGKKRARSTKAKADLEEETTTRKKKSQPAMKAKQEEKVKLEDDEDDEDDDEARVTSETGDDDEA